ncbi:hypothetical protein CCACVL1_03642 [Corchorus capsularis]|uniref:Uncharacterized protein n=1 Tax=Corchorus capsularis TaxID=210143 RepID=A0A1R3JY72_COCAP|nr:hypothetical protein CCACVL1_03642 [Corchorus capsularis]
MRKKKKGKGFSVGWFAPPFGLYKLDVDAAYRAETGIAKDAVVVRDS